jgi:hypothetical protein
VPACRVGRDDGFAAALLEPASQLGGGVSSVSNQATRRRYSPEEFCRSDQFVCLPRCHGESQGAARGIGYGVNFGRPSPARLADRLLEVPPFAPAAERCALTCVASTAVVLTTPFDPLRAQKTSSQTPCLLQRLKRL